MGVGNIVQTGLKAAMTNIETISNNIANANTVGFKKSHVNFADIYMGGALSGKQSGLGVKTSSIQQDFSTGRIELTDRGLDLSLSNDGFFVQKEKGHGQISYTRVGQLDVDKEGFLVGVGGYLQGYPAVDGRVIASGSLIDMRIPDKSIPAQATSSVGLKLNLDASASVLDPDDFDIDDATTYTYRTDSTFYDSLGTSHALSLFLIKSDDNEWTAKITMDNAALGDGTLEFTGDGLLNNATGFDALSWNPGGGAGGASIPQAFSMNFTGTTQFAGDNTLYDNTQDGFPAGVPTGFNLDGDGRLNVYYSNGRSQIEGQIAVARFKAPQGLVRTANMAWLATLESGDPLLSMENSDGAIHSGTLELSNVDLTEELVSLIGAQHDFQANAQAQQTYNQILQTIEKL
ncbi:flagellar hook protein FlgE [Legionella nagasakiensis]|uniref:flagellar hook protein FlgE n=1 Tax=Legionella nagasakiensis TaxID=535290 RepID=UPI0013EFBF7B|nr:flagellar hook protein FlgE [Legionella nagasakiensis]